MTLSQLDEPDSIMAAPLRARPLVPLAQRGWYRLALPIILIAIAIGAFVAGLKLRFNAYIWTEGSHYYGDAYNAYRYGYYAVQYPPLLDFPETISKGIPEYRQGKFDYPPLRLTMSYLYALWMARNFPGSIEIPHWGNYHMIVPMLNFNTATEFISAIFVFLLIRMWTIRADDARRPIDVPPAPYRGAIKGLIGAMIFWFNPAILMDAHAWPQWDVWFFPFVLGAMLLASVEAWLLAGALLAIGAFFKGQVLLSLPFFIFWPLFRGKVGSILNLIGGFVLAAGLAALPWMRPTTPAIVWFILLNLALVLVAAFALRFRLKYMWFIGLTAAAMLLAWPWKSPADLPYRLMAVALIALAGWARLLAPRLSPAIFSLCVGLAAFAVIPLFNGKTYWYDVAYDYGSRKFMNMAVAGTHNLPSILVSYFHVGGSGEGNPQLTMDVPLLGSVMIRKFLIGVNLLCAIICGIGAAMHSRKPDSRMLLALATPMLCAFVVMPQLNNRYAVWAAGLSALLAGVSVELSLLGILISVVAWEGMAQLMYIPSSPAPDIRTDWSPYLPRLSTHLGWIMVLAAAIYLYMIFAPRRTVAATPPLAA